MSRGSLGGVLIKKSLTIGCKEGLSGTKEFYICD